MGFIYLAALVVGLGAILLPSILGGHGGDGADGGDGGEPDHDGASAHAGHGEPLVALFLSLRFWSFAALGFGLSGSLLHLFALAAPGAVLALALGSGALSGLFAALAFRALGRAAVGTAAATSDAVGRVGRVIVACARGRVGQVRLELGGQLVDLAATTSEEVIPRGADVVVVEVRPSAPVHVATAPPELRE
jgi:membrane protein implicated in regulation of membrane protease activity